MDRFDRVVPSMSPGAIRPETNLEFRENLIRHDLNKWLDNKPGTSSSFGS